MPRVIKPRKRPRSKESRHRERTPNNSRQRYHYSPRNHKKKHIRKPQVYPRRRFRRSQSYSSSQSVSSPSSSSIRSSSQSHSYSRRSPSSSYSSSASSSQSGSNYSSSGSQSVSPSTRQRRKTPHFQYRVGEKLGHKYKVTRLLGTGTFGRVVEGQYDHRYYAIKVIKPVQKYIDSAKTEKGIIKDLCSRDPADRYHLVRYIESIYHFNYYCLVFEQLGPSLYDLLKKNKFVGFYPKQVQSFGRQLFESVGFMHRQGFTHTDLKPQNILLKSDVMIEGQPIRGNVYYVPYRTGIKLIDFGGATYRSEFHSQIINTRQYRGPEVILQCCEWNESSDVWSIGCILVELITGQLLFHVHDDIDHIYMIEKLLGRFPRWMTEHCQSQFTKLFHRDGSIFYDYADQFVQNFQQILKMQSLSEILSGEREFLSLIRKCLQIDPHKRITCEQALRHHFFDLIYN